MMNGNDLAQETTLNCPGTIYATCRTYRNGKGWGRCFRIEVTLPSAQDIDDPEKNNAPKAIAHQLPGRPGTFN